MPTNDDSFCFGDFVLDRTEKLLTRGGRPISLPPKALQLLLVLVENRGRIVEKDALMERVWADTFVEEGNLAYTVRMLRKALHDDAGKPKFIDTVPRRGYRFIGEVSDATGRQGHAGPKDRFIPDDSAGPFVGRAKELSDIAGLLGRNNVRLVTLTGTGGTGKTRLAKEIALRLQDSFPDGVFFVGLESVTEASLVPTVVAHSLGVTEPGHRSAGEVLADHFRGTSSLLVLDNFEQILEASSAIARLLKDAHPLKVLVTSREPLRLNPENEYKVPPLPVPPVASDETSLALMRYEAVQFFVERARRARSDFEVSESHLRTISSICNRLDGLPLALELAAARAKILSAPEILAKLENSLRLLTGGARDLPGRHRTMRATIAWSYDLLSDEEKSIFARLAVFEGGFTFEAAEAVLSARNEDVDGVAILDAITSLTNKGLLIPEHSFEGQRFRMLVVVREFALELLAGSGEFAATARSHAEYFLNLAEKAEPKLQTPEVGDWVRRLELEHDNIRSAVKWSMTADVSIAARIAKAVRLFWMLRGFTREGQYWYREILKGENVPREYRWILLTGLANMTQFRGDLGEAEAIYRQSLEESQALGDQKFIAQSMRGVAGALYMRGDAAAARGLVLQAIEISRAFHDEFGIAAGLARLGDIALFVGDAGEARKRGAEALEIFRRLGFGPGIASKLMNLGFAEIADGELDLARANLIESLRFANEIGDYITTRLALEGHSFLLCEVGDHFNAARLSAAAFRMGEAIDHLLEAAEMRMRNLYVEKLKAEMGHECYADAYSQGFRMERNEAIDLALSANAEPRPQQKLRLVQKRAAERSDTSAKR